MKQLTEQRIRRAYSAPAMDIIALKPALQLLGISDADLIIDFHDEDRTVYEDEVW